MLHSYKSNGFRLVFDSVALYGKQNKGHIGGYVAMYCENCGKALPDEANFCPNCGNPPFPIFSKARKQGQTDFLQRINNAAGYLVPQKIKNTFPGIMPIFIIGVYLGIFVMIVTAASIFIESRHDLSGTYQTGEYFPIQQVTFDKNGYFSVVNSGSGYMETYQGIYKKRSNGKYSCEFREGASAGGSPVTQYEADSMGRQCELAVWEVDENTLKIQIIPKVSYYAWGGKSVYFYK